MIGQRLKIARAASGLSLRDLEAKIDNRVSAQAIGKYERDEDMPSSGVLSVLARALAVSEDYLLSADEMLLEGVEFRKKHLTSKKEEAYVEGQTLHLLERYLAIEEVLGMRTVEWNCPVEAPYPVKELADVENAARALRTSWSLGIDPIPNLSELLEEQGIKVLSMDLKDIDGLTANVKRPGKRALPVIVVKDNIWSERKRFTLAHELGHMVLDIASHLDAEKVVNRFAGSFLMPVEALWREVGKHRTVISLGELLHLKKLFGTSLQAISYRCRELGIISESGFKKLFDVFTKAGWRKEPYEEPGAIPPEKERPHRMERLCFRALAERIISESKAAELLGISVRELNRIMDEPAVA